MILGTAFLGRTNSRAKPLSSSFAGVGTALGLVLWFSLFTLPTLIAASVIRLSHPRLGQMVGFFSPLILALGVIWVAKFVWGGEWRKAVPMRKVSPGVLLWAALCVLAFLPIDVACGATVAKIAGWPDLPDPRNSVVGVLGLVIGVPLGEELLFRGYGLARIVELGGERRAVFFTAIVFALIHGAWIKLPGNFAIGIFFGWLVLRTGSLWPTIFGHFINNLTVLSLDVGFHHYGISIPSKPSWPLIMVLATIGVACQALLWTPKCRSRLLTFSDSDTP